MEVRQAVPEDADGLAEAVESAEASGMMLFAPGERGMTADGAAVMINRLREDPASTLLVAHGGGRVAGYLIARGDDTLRTRHRAYVVVGVHEDCRGRGIGRALFDALGEWAAARGLRRLELTVRTDNEGGVALYKRAGFEVEGIKRDSLLVAGRYVDEYYMAKLI
ncbi:GNAT family N-acetyltransferase [Bhargavaea cecembensis]|uniref:GNAT family N-acetyltransferase n=1 Tax=Bhargavaea cecembensis TaxID=394098 RepID=UPI00058C4ABA|nr:GNAT family N-acetyltransferase [Bhargavaea cecembensis]